MTDGNYPPKCFKMPKRAGAMSANNRLLGEAVCTMNLVAGRALSGAALGETTTSATGRTIAFGSGTAAGSVTLYAALNAQAFMAGTAAGTTTTAATGTEALCAMAGTAAGDSTATGQKNALAQCIGVAAGTCTAIMTSYATGSLVGHIYCNDGDASISQMVDGVWNAGSAIFNEPGTMGERLNDSGSSSNPWAETLPGEYIVGQAGHTLSAINDLVTKIKYATCNELNITESSGDITIKDDAGIVIATIPAAITSLAGLTKRKKIL
jgi:hypothetical protein